MEREKKSNTQICLSKSQHKTRLSIEKQRFRTQNPKVILSGNAFRNHSKKIFIPLRGVFLLILPVSLNSKERAQVSEMEDYMLCRNEIRRRRPAIITK